ncbi:type VII secretion target [Streptacidiphilus anmyonensis]|uniref:type VII secretion target n=1 Tax=Streptacidiphilus anmyonensis TaxID=405782 RepID=UPI0005A6F41D|nr:type VII secretion target [Streptacidiphilus anmyonensis]
MASGFEVDVQALQRLASDLGQAVHSMAAARAELSAASHGRTGDGSLDRACDEFQHKWGYGLQQLEKTAGAFVEGLGATAKAYQTVEEEIQKSFGGSGSGGGHGMLTPIDQGPRYEPGPVHRPVIEPGPIEQPGPIERPGPVGEPPVGEPVGFIPPPRIRFGPTPEPTAPQNGGAAQ